MAVSEFVLSFQADMFDDYPNASGFTFRTKLYYTNWPSYPMVNDLIIAKHITTTDEKPSTYTRKNIYKPKYMHAGKIHNHHPKPAQPDNPL